MKDKFRGSLLGLAIGDALGMPFEGKNKNYILELWDGKSFLARAGLSPGEWTDDTQLAVFHAEDLIEHGRVDINFLSCKFTEWVKSGMAFRQGIGRTTLEAIKRMEMGIEAEKAGKTGKWAAGNGGAMRVAPIGLFYFDDLEMLKEEVYKAVFITHNNKEAINGAIAIAYVVADAVRGNKPEWELLNRVADFIGDCLVSRRLKEVACGKYSSLKSTAYVVDGVVLSIYCYIKFSDAFESSIRAAVGWGGDTDTVAAMTGAMSGAYYGVSGIPQEWIKGLSKSDFLVELADRLFYKAIERREICGKGKGQVLRYSS